MLSKTLILSIMMAESSFNPLAESPVGAQGLMQLMPIAVDEVAQTYKLPRDVDRFDPDANVLYGVLLLDHYARQTRNLDELLAMYHGGYRQRNRIRSGRDPVGETRAYIHRVRSLMRDADRGALRSPYSSAIDRAFAELEKRSGGFRQPRGTFAIQPVPDLYGRYPGAPATHGGDGAGRLAQKWTH